MMNTKALEKFAQSARRQLQEQVAAKLERVLKTDTAELRAQSQAITELKKQIKSSSREAVVERVAYTWFNRFCALRYMDVNHYTRIGVVSPAADFTQPEILQEAKQGLIDEELPVDRQAVFGLLQGPLPSKEPQQEAYRLLLVAACNHYHDVMPFLFERIDDYTELLMPDDLLSQSSILQATRTALTAAACRDVEVIGWLYQFYISEKKDAVIKAKKKITAENIPAATQLFTPHWIVRFLVENSLGRLWLLNRPNSRLAERMDYYTKPEQPETGFLRVSSPEELKVCDPAVGSGHMLTYAFDLLYAIYEEAGYNAPDIPRLILTRNLYGMEIDERAGALAAFALAMKARAKDRRFFRRNVRPNICVLQPVAFKEEELSHEVEQILDMSFRGVFDEESEIPRSARNDMREALLHDLNLFKEADNFGSLLRPQLTVRQVATIRAEVKTRAGTGQMDWLLQDRQRRVLRALAQAAYLAQKYHVVVANPPYMGSGNTNDQLRAFLNDSYKDVKFDLFSAFTVRIMEMTRRGSFIGMMTPFNWMFLSSFEGLRRKILDEFTVTNLVRPEFHAFFDSAYVSICGFTLFTKPLPDFNGAFIDLDNFYGADIQPVRALEAIQNPDCGWFYRVSAADLKKVPGTPVAYWVNSQVRNVFQTAPSLDELTVMRKGLATADNNRFLRHWYEVSMNRSKFDCQSREESRRSGKKWFPINKGGPFRKWYGNNEVVINWFNDGYEIRNFRGANGRLRSRPQNLELSFLPALTWTKITSGSFSARYCAGYFLFDDAGAICHSPDEDLLKSILPILSSKIGNHFLQMLNSTMNFQIGDVAKVPVCKPSDSSFLATVEKCIELSRADWDFLETSWDFVHLPLLHQKFRSETLAETYAALRTRWREMTIEMQRLEEGNNRIFIDAYGLQGELTPDVPPEEITLTCNPHYRYGSNYGEEELEARLLADTMREFISYAVGCMFGRYSLDKPGLILANQGETLDDYLRRVPNPTFMPDKDNAIPMLDGDWFTDDIGERFKKFLRVTFGEEHYEENLAFIEAALGRDVRSYFLRDFYDDHVKMYKKRPIYWLFSSHRGTFNALIYMHRYRPDTVSVVLNDYLREFRAKLNGRKHHLQQVSISAAGSQRDKTRALKEIDQIDKILHELREYEDEVLYPLATRQVAIDLDDGVKVNYNKFGAALKKITGLSE